jgi:hypothetical protein
MGSGTAAGELIPVKQTCIEPMGGNFQDPNRCVGVRILGPSSFQRNHVTRFRYALRTQNIWGTVLRTEERPKPGWADAKNKINKKQAPGQTCGHVIAAGLYKFNTD